MKNKVIIIIIAILAILLIGGGVFMSYKSTTSSSKDNNKEQEVEKEATKALVDNLNTNIEETLRAQRVYKKTLRFGDAGIGQLGIHYIITVNVENISTAVTEHQHLDLTFLSNTGKVLGIAEIEVPELQPGEKTKIETDSTNEKIYDAFDYKISIASEAKISEQ